MAHVKHSILSQLRASQEETNAAGFNGEAGIAKDPGRFDTYNAEDQRYFHQQARHCLRMARSCLGAEPRNRPRYSIVWRERAADYRETLIDQMRRRQGWTLKERISGRPQDPSRFDKYLHVVEWLRDRYTHDGKLVIAIGGKPSAYTRFERLAAQRYLGV
jgi:hypothetical protein